MSEQREMTLDEWVNLLPEFHLANKQYQKLKQHNNELVTTVERLRDVVLDEVLKWVDGNDELLVRRIWDSLRLKMLEISPQQSLAERDYKIAYNAFHAGVVYADTVPKGTGDTSGAANEYAQRIKEGK